MPGYIETLSEEQLGSLSEVIDPEFALNLRDGEAEAEEVALVVDKLFDSAPKVIKEGVFYRTLAGDGAEDLRQGGELVDNSFLLLTDKESEVPGDEESVTLVVMIPAGTPIIETGEGGYILPRGANLDLDPTETGLIPAKIVKFEVKKQV